MKKNEILNMLCGAINDCEDNKMLFTVETLNAVLQELELKLPNEYFCEGCGHLKEDEVYRVSLFPDILYCQKCGNEIDEYE